MIKFRKIKNDADLEMIMNWRSLPEVTKFMYTDIEPDMERQREWFRRISSDRRRKDWIIVFDNIDVGLLSLYDIDVINQRCEWSYYVGRVDLRGKGIGKNVELNVLEYVFERMKLNKLCCVIIGFNRQGVELHERYGSVVEGTRFQHIFKNGQFHDIIEMGALSSVWFDSIKPMNTYVSAYFEE